MNRRFKVVLWLITWIVTGFVLGWWLIVGFCSLPGIPSGLCGHNTGLWFPIFIPIGMVISGVLILWLTRASPQGDNSSRNGGADD